AAGALLYAFARPVWFSAVQAEVYALSGLLFIAALYAIVLLYYEGGTRHLIVSATLCGLVLTHHFSAGVVIASLVIVIAIRFRTDRMARSMAVAV
ncbi:MAG: protein O-mannosyl-transferase family, partial [Candidatus Thorarchaeota archaeon]